MFLIFLILGGGPDPKIEGGPGPPWPHVQYFDRNPSLMLVDFPHFEIQRYWMSDDNFE